MTNLYKMNVQRCKSQDYIVNISIKILIRFIVDELNGFKRELEITKSEKESQEKDTLQKAAALRTQLQEIERNHTINIEDLNANHRIEYQRLEDNNLNHSRRLNTIETEVSDAKRRLEVEVRQLDRMKEENEALRSSIESLSIEYDDLDNENRNLEDDMKVKVLPKKLKVQMLIFQL